LALSQLSKNPQPAHAAIWKNIEPQMRNGSSIQELTFKKVPGVGL
jgi:hypothetical protein